MHPSSSPKILFLDIIASGLDSALLFIRKLEKNVSHTIWEIKINRSGIAPIINSKIISKRALMSYPIKTNHFISHWEEFPQSSLIDILTFKSIRTDRLIDNKNAMCIDKNNKVSSISIIFQWLDKALEKHSIYGYIQKIQIYKHDLILTIKSPHQYTLTNYPTYLEKGRQQDTFYIYDDIYDYFEKDIKKKTLNNDVLTDIPHCLKLWNLCLYEFR